MSDFLTGILVHLLEQCRSEQTEIHVFTLSRRGPVTGRVAAIGPGHVVIASSTGPETTNLPFDDILRVGTPSGTRQGVAS